MLPDNPPPLRTYPLVSPTRFTTSPRGWRTSDELADFLGLSRIGLKGYQWNGDGRRLYGPQYTRKVGGYRDADVARWVIHRSKMDLHWLGYHQHTHPSETNKSEAKVSIESLIEAYSIQMQ